jgi:hypothetical protein
MVSGKLADMGYFSNLSAGERQGGSRPEKIEVAINLKTTKQIGMAIPPNLLIRANKVIRKDGTEYGESSGYV